MGFKMYRLGKEKFSKKLVVKCFINRVNSSNMYDHVCQQITLYKFEITVASSECKQDSLQYFSS